MACLFSRLALVAFALAFLHGCSGNPGGSAARQCSNGLDAAYGELSLAESQGFSGTVAWTKAASLLTAAKVQQGFEKYPNCIDKVTRARKYIAQSKQG